MRSTDAEEDVVTDRCMLRSMHRMDAEDPDFQKRWNAWQEKNRLAEEAFRKRLQIILPILIVLGIVAYFYLVR